MTHNIYDRELREGLEKEAARVAKQTLAAIRAGRKTLVDGSKVPLGMKLVRDEDEEAKLEAAEIRCRHPIPSLALCPECWFGHGIEVEIVPTGHNSESHENYRCAAHCGWDAEVALGP